MLKKDQTFPPFYPQGNRREHWLASSWFPPRDVWGLSWRTAHPAVCCNAELQYLSFM